MGAHRAVIQEIGAAEKELPKDAKLKRLRNKILAIDEQKQERVGKRFLTDSSNWSFGDGGEPGEADEEAAAPGTWRLGDEWPVKKESNLSAAIFLPRTTLPSSA
jgi:hypothetical protein